MPVLVTVPVKSSKEPGATGPTGQTLVTAMAGVVTIGQVTVTLLVTATPQMLRPVAVEVLVLEQLAGAR